MRVSGTNPSEPNPSESNSTPLVASDHLPITRNIEGTNVLSWNIRWSANDDPSVWQNRLPAIVDTVKDANPDVLCFQEVSPDMLKDLKGYLSQYGYACDDNTFSQSGTLATFYNKNTISPASKSAEKLYRPADHIDGESRYYLLNEFTNLATGEPIRIANLKGPHLVEKGTPTDAQVNDVLTILQKDVNETLDSWGESHKDVNLCGDWNNTITSGAIGSLGMVNHSQVTGLGTQVGGAYGDAIKGIQGKQDQLTSDNFKKIDDQFLEMNGNTGDAAQIDKTLFAWGGQPTPPPQTPIQKYEAALTAWVDQAKDTSGYLRKNFIEPVIKGINNHQPAFEIADDVSKWLNNDPNGKILIAGLLSSKIYSTDPDLANMDPIQAQKELQSLLTTLGVKATAPLYPMAPIPPGPTPGYIDQLEKAMNGWAGPNPPYGTSGKQALDTYLVSYVQTHNITSADGLKSAMADFLKTDDKRGIYFKCPGLNDTDLASAFTVMGLSPAPTVPPMDNIDKSYSNIVNYCNTHTKDATHYMKPFYALRDYMANNVNLSEKDLTSFVNGPFRSDPNINYKTFSSVPAYQHQLQWFSTTNLPDWKP